jgi:hypothetical protein
VTSFLEWPGFVTLANRLWRDLPARARRVSPVLGAILGDGSYLRAWPALAAVAPPALLATGLLIGANHSRETYTYSLTLVVFFAAVAGLGAALGFWTWLGYVVGDLVLFDRDPFPLFAAGGTDVYVPAAISYALLAWLLVLTPVIATGVRFRLVRALGPWTLGKAAAGFACHAVVLGALAYSWAQSTAFLIRPLWSYQDLTPDIEAINPLQAHSSSLARAAVIAVAARAVLTLLPYRDAATRAAAAAQAPAPGAATASRLPAWVRIPLTAVALTFLLSGLTSGTGQDRLVCGLFVAILFFREFVVARLPVWGEFLPKIPLVARAGAACLISYWIAKDLVPPEVEKGAVSFSSIVRTVVLSMLVTALLVPPERPTTQAAER